MSLSRPQHLHRHPLAATAVGCGGELAGQREDTVEYDERRFGTYDVLLHQDENRFKDTFVGVGGKGG